MKFAIQPREDQRAGRSASARRQRSRTTIQRGSGVTIENLEPRRLLSTVTVDVTALGAAGTSADGNVIVTHVDPTSSSGSGVVSPFLRTHNQDVEEGYNTSSRSSDSQLLDDITNLPFTHDLKLADVPTVTIQGTLYREFTLDLGEPGNDTSDSGLVNFAQLKFFTGPSAEAHLTGDAWTGSIDGTTLRYDLDASGDTDFTLRDLSSGNGKTDYVMDVKDSAFAGASSSDFLYMYVKFGSPPPTADGTFEEWSTTPASNLDSSIATTVHPDGTVAYDSAVVTHAGSPTAEGTVTYTLYNAANDAVVAGHTVTLNNDGTVPDSSAVGGVDSALAPGDYYYVATYSGDTQYSAAIGKHEPFTVEGGGGGPITIPGSVSGMKFEDHDGDGTKDVGDQGLAGWVFDLYADDGSEVGVLDSSDTPLDTQTTDSDGNYTFGGLAAGTYFVREDAAANPSGWTQTTDDPDLITLGSNTVDTTTTVDNVTGIEFGNFKNIDISGTKYQDHTGDGFAAGNALTTPTTTFTVYLYKDTGDGLYNPATDDLVATTTTAANGTYSFSNNGPGTYFTVEGASGDGDAGNWIQTDHQAGTVATSSGVNSEDNNFANAHLTTHTGLTIGFYGNSNGQALLCTTDAKGKPTTTLKTAVASFLQGILGNGTNSVLVNSTASGKTTTYSYLTTANLADYSKLQSLLKNASATNMANMLSAQLLATVLNCYFSSTTGVSVTESIDVSKVTLVSTNQGQTNAQIIAGLVAGGTGIGTNANPGVTLVTDADTTDKFIDIQSLINAAVQELKTHPNTTASGLDRTFMESLKNCFDAINNRENIFLV